MSVQIFNSELDALTTPSRREYATMPEPVGGFGIWNGQFEQGPDGLHPRIDGWEQTAYAGGAVARTGNGLAGHFSVRGGNSGIGQGGYICSQRYLPVDEDTDYFLGASFRGGSANSEVSLGVQCYDESKALLGTVSAVALETPGVAWVKYAESVGPTGTVAFPAGTRYVRVVAILQSDIALNNDWAEVDDVWLSPFATGGTPTAHNLLSITHPDTVPSAVTQGGLIIGSGTPLTYWTQLAAGAPDDVLVMSGLEPAWVVPPYAPLTRILTAGAGLTGGGDLSADRTFDVGAGTGIVVNANDVAIANTAVVPAAYGDATHVAAFTVDQQGRLTTASSVAITGVTPAAHDIVGALHTVAGAIYQVVGLTAANVIGLLTPTVVSAANSLVRTDASGYIRATRLEFGGATNYVEATGGNQVAIYGSSYVSLRVGAAVLVADGTYFYDFAAVSGLGIAAKRWTSIYGVEGNYSGDVTIATAGKGIIMSANTSGYVPIANGTRFVPGAIVKSMLPSHAHPLTYTSTASSGWSTYGPAISKPVTLNADGSGGIVGYWDYYQHTHQYDKADSPTNASVV